MSGLLPGDARRTVVNLFEQAKDRIADALGHGDDRPPPPTAGAVDPARYAGRWYELARLPMAFQADVTVSTAEYGVREDGTLSVTNTAYRGDDVEATIEGAASAAEGAEQTYDRLVVKFGGILRFLPVSDDGNYWILKVADDYSLALVGTPDRRSLWMLGRAEDAWRSDPRVPGYIELAAELGYPIGDLLVADWSRRVTSAAD